MGAAVPAYTPRRAQASPLWALVSEHGEAVARVWEEKFERILRHRGEWGGRRERGPPAEPPRGEAAPGVRERRVVVDEHAQEFGREDEGGGAGTSWDAGQSAEREWGA